MDISFILPTNREYDLFSKKVIDNINSLNFMGKKFEIIVVSPNVIEGENVVFLKENELNKGCVGAYNAGYKISKGKYIILCSDDHFFDKNAPSIIDILKSDLYRNRKYKIICLPTNFHGSCLLPDYCESKSIIARYPVFERSTIENHLDGYIYHPKFKHHYPDHWLGFWLGEQGEDPIEYNDFNMVTFSNSCDKSFDGEDEHYFKELINKYKNGYKNYV